MDVICGHSIFMWAFPVRRVEFSHQSTCGETGNVEEETKSQSAGISARMWHLLASVISTSELEERQAGRR